WTLTADGHEKKLGEAGAPESVSSLRKKETKRRSALGGRLESSADAYLARRGKGRTILAGYPWFGDWGRDTFISVRGLCLATGRRSEAGEILREWAGAVSKGMLPNRFPDRGEEPEYNSVDASLWYVVAVYEYREALKAAGGKLAAGDAKRFNAAIEAILAGHA